MAKVVKSKLLKSLKSSEKQPLLKENVDDSNGVPAIENNSGYHDDVPQNSKDTGRVTAPEMAPQQTQTSAISAKSAQTPKKAPLDSVSGSSSSCTQPVDEKTPLIPTKIPAVMKKKSYATMPRSGEGSEQNPDAVSCDEETASTSFIYVVTTLSAIGGFLFGYDTGIVSGAMVFIREHFDLSDLWQEIIVSATILAAWIFSAISGPLTHRYGRKKVILAASLIFTGGGILMGLAHDRYTLLAGRFIVGIAIGLASMVIPIYIAEVAPGPIRGKLVAINQLCITGGQFVASVVSGLFSKNVDSGWRWMLGLAAVPSIIQFVFFIFMPMSPRWLASKGRYDEAKEALNRCRAGHPQEKINREFDSIRRNIEANQENSEATFFQILKVPMIRRALFIGCLLQCYQQLAGINTVMYYSATIIQMSGINDKSTAVWLSAVTSFMNFLCSFIGMAFVDRFGRRILVLISMTGVVLSLLILSGGFELASLQSPAVDFTAQTNNSHCINLPVNNCGECVKAPNCGYCFQNAPGVGMQWTGVPDVNGTCVGIDPKNHDYADSLSGFCSKDSPQDWVFAKVWCPSNYSWLILFGLVAYLLCFAPGMGPMPWTVNSEIYPLWARSTCVATSTATNWLFNLVVSLTFLTLSNALTSQGAYLLYSIISATGLIFFYFFLPETKGKTLEEIEVIFQQPLGKMRYPLTDVIDSNSVNNSDSNSNRDRNSITEVKA